jgi:hypothetical protein
MDVELRIPTEFTTSAVLGYVRSCRVVLLDLNSFPSDVKDLEEVAEVIFGFVAFVWHSFRSDVCWSMFFRQAPGFAFMCNQAVTLNLISILTAADGSKLAFAQMVTLFTLAGCFFAVFIVESWSDIAVGNLRIKGKGEWRELFFQYLS